jgi:hypothetical protein
MSNYQADASDGRQSIVTDTRDVETNYNVIEGNENGIEIVQHKIDQTFWIAVPQDNDSVILMPAALSPYPSTT